MLNRPCAIFGNRAVCMPSKRCNNCSAHFNENRPREHFLRRMLNAAHHKLVANTRAALNQQIRGAADRPSSKSTNPVGVPLSSGAALIDLVQVFHSTHLDDVAERQKILQTAPLRR